MGVKRTNIDPTGDTLTIADTGQSAAHGETIEVDNEIAKRLSPAQWATPKQAEKDEQSSSPSDEVDA